MGNRNKTDIEIDEDIKKNTTKCKKDFKCLRDNNYELCKVIESVRDNVLFIECLEMQPCSYKTVFGYSSYICSCPTRKEIYRRYKF
jgi:hypothetical protein